MGKSMVVYFSRSGENYWNGSMKVLEKGNTQLAAEKLADFTGGRLFRVETEEPYPENYRACVERAVKELKEGIRPELKECPESLEGYDTFYIGYPNWCGTMPMAMAAFLERYDWTGKRIFPFCTNEGSGMGRSEADLKKLCPGALVGEGLSIRGTQAADCGPRIGEWLRTCL